MANSILIQVRGDTAANWTEKNPILKDREQGYDKTNNIMKVGNGTTAWNNLPATPEIVNGLTSTNANAALSAAQGKALADRITTLENKPSVTGVTVTDNLTSTSATAALSANQGRILNGKIPVVSTATNSTSTTTAASSSAVKAAYDLANTANNKIPSGTILTSSNYSSYVSSGISQGVTSVDGYYYSSGSVTVPSGGTWLVICFLDGIPASTSGYEGSWGWPSISVGIVAGGTTITSSNVSSYLKSNYTGSLNRFYSTSYTSNTFANYILKNFLFLRVK